jgi:hypothetical protein
MLKRKLTRNRIISKRARNIGNYDEITVPAPTLSLGEYSYGLLKAHDDYNTELQKAIDTTQSKIDEIKTVLTKSDQEVLAYYGGNKYPADTYWVTHTNPKTPYTGGGYGTLTPEIARWQLQNSIDGKSERVGGLTLTEQIANYKEIQEDNTLSRAYVQKQVNDVMDGKPPTYSNTPSAYEAHLIAEGGNEEIIKQLVNDRTKPGTTPGTTPPTPGTSTATKTETEAAIAALKANPTARKALLADPTIAKIMADPTARVAFLSDPTVVKTLSNPKALKYIAENPDEIGTWISKLVGGSSTPATPGGNTAATAKAAKQTAYTALATGLATALPLMAKNDDAARTASVTAFSTLTQSVVDMVGAIAKANADAAYKLHPYPDNYVLVEIGDTGWGKWQAPNSIGYVDSPLVPMTDKKPPKATAMSLSDFKARPEVMAVLSTSAVRTALADPTIKIILGNPTARKALFDKINQAVLNPEAMNVALSNPKTMPALITKIAKNLPKTTFQDFMQRPEMKAMMATTAVQSALKNPDVQAALKNPKLRAALSDPKVQAALSNPNTLMTALSNPKTIPSLINKLQGGSSSNIKGLTAKYPELSATIRANPKAMAAFQNPQVQSALSNPATRAAIRENPQFQAAMKNPDAIKNFMSDPKKVQAALAKIKTITPPESKSPTGYKGFISQYPGLQDAIRSNPRAMTAFQNDKVRAAMSSTKAQNILQSSRAKAFLSDPQKVKAALNNPQQIRNMLEKIGVSYGGSGRSLGNYGTIKPKRTRKHTELGEVYDLWGTAPKRKPLKKKQPKKNTFCGI